MLESMEQIADEERRGDTPQPVCGRVYIDSDTLNELMQLNLTPQDFINYTSVPPEWFDGIRIFHWQYLRPFEISILIENGITPELTKKYCLRIAEELNSHRFSNVSHPEHGLQALIAINESTPPQHLNISAVILDMHAKERVKPTEDCGDLKNMQKFARIVYSSRDYRRNVINFSYVRVFGEKESRILLEAGISPEKALALTKILEVVFGRACPGIISGEDGCLLKAILDLHNARISPRMILSDINPEDVRTVDEIIAHFAIR